MRSVSVVVPVYNSEHSLESFHERLSDALSSTSREYEIIYVDDHSSDSSLRLCSALLGEGIRVLSLSKNAGQQAATLLGLAVSSKELCVTIDDDGQYPPEQIGLLCRTLEHRGLDCLYGIPLRRSSSTVRTFGTRLVDFVVRLLTGKSPEVRISSFRVMTSELCESVVCSRAKSPYLSVEILRRATGVQSILIEGYRSSTSSRYHLLHLIGLLLGIVFEYTVFEPFRTTECLKRLGYLEVNR